MKKLILIFAVVFTTLLGCTNPDAVAHDVTEIIVIDSSGIIEDIYAPGTFITVYDTLVLTIDTKYNIDTQENKVVYSTRRK